MGRDESGKNRDESAAGWDESAARACQEVSVGGDGRRRLTFMAYAIDATIFAAVFAALVSRNDIFLNI
jgi:hypothetical protein